MRIVIAIAALLLFAAAPQKKKELGEVSRGPDTSVADAAQALQGAQLPPGTNFVAYRRHALPLLWQPTLKVDGKAITSLGEKSFTALQLPPGPHRVVFDWPRFSGHGDPSGTVLVEAGKIVVMEITAWTDGRRYSSSVEMRGPSTVTEILACCTFKAPKP